MTERRLTPPAERHAWVVVANAARARCFERDPDSGAMREIRAFVHPAARQKGSDLDHDRGGQARKSAAATAFAPHTEAHERERTAFAHELASYLDGEALAHHYDEWSLFASTPFLGDLRAELGDAARRALGTSIALDLTTCQGRDLEQRVTRALGEAPH